MKQNRCRPNPKAQWQGKVNKAQGASFERLIDQSCEHYRTAGTAVIEKTPEPFHIVGTLSNGRFIGNFAKAAQPDYKGVLAGGRMIAFEAKHSANDQIKQDRVTEEQAIALDSYEKAGALCFVFVALQMQQFFLIPWREWKCMKQRYGRKYMTAVDLRPYAKEFNSQWIKFL